MQPALARHHNDSHLGGAGGPDGLLETRAVVAQHLAAFGVHQLGLVG